MNNNPHDRMSVVATNVDDKLSQHPDHSSVKRGSQKPPVVAPKPKPRPRKPPVDEESVLKNFDDMLDSQEGSIDRNMTMETGKDNHVDSMSAVSASNVMHCLAHVTVSEEQVTDVNETASENVAPVRDSVQMDTTDSQGSADDGVIHTACTGNNVASRNKTDCSKRESEACYANYWEIHSMQHPADSACYANLEEIRSFVSFKQPVPRTTHNTDTMKAQQEMTEVDDSGDVITSKRISSECRDVLPEALPLKMVRKQGHLYRQKVLDGGKKAKKNWSVSFVMLVEDKLYFFKEQKTDGRLKSVESLGKSEAVLPLKDAAVRKLTTTGKHGKEVIEVTLANVTSYLLHSSDTELLDHWFLSLENNIIVSRSCDDDSAVMDSAAVRPPGSQDVVFGTSLSELCGREHGIVPRFVQECVVAVERRGLAVDGIYRVSGNMASVQKLRSMVDQNELYDLNSSVWDIHVVTSALKLFFRELPEPVVSHELCDRFLDANVLPDRSSKLTEMRSLLHRLPQPSLETLKYLFSHLTKVIQHSKDNRMLPQNLAIVFGPTLLSSTAASDNLAVNIVHQGQLVEFMIIETAALFT